MHKRGWPCAVTRKAMQVVAFVGPVCCMLLLMTVGARSTPGLLTALSTGALGFGAFSHCECMLVCMLLCALLCCACCCACCCVLLYVLLCVRASCARHRHPPARRTALAPCPSLPPFTSGRCFLL